MPDATASDAMDALLDADAAGSDVTFIGDDSSAGPLHELLPVLPATGGPVIAHPALVVVTFADEPNVDALEAYNRWIVGSSWMATAASEYGIGAGSFVGSVRLPQNAPTTITDAEIQTLLTAGITDGSIPRPSGGLASAIYVLYLPAHTTATTRFPGGSVLTSCVDFRGYHAITHGTTPFVYAPVANCNDPSGRLDPLELEQYITSHEIIEAATDPDQYVHPGWVATLAADQVWVVVYGGETGDLCEFDQYFVARESGHPIQPVYSTMRAEMNRGNPCVPSEPGHPYYNTSATPEEITAANPGDTVTYQLVGWSDTPAISWNLSVTIAGPLLSGQLTPTFQLSPTTMTPGGTATLTVSIPANAVRHTGAKLRLRSARSATEWFEWPLAIVVR